MKITIYRGTKQIGGCITEISTDHTRVFIDFGSELPNENADTVVENLSIDGLTKGSINCDGVFFTHNHGDHIGMLAEILPGILLYMGEASKEIYISLQKRVDRSIVPIIEGVRTFRPSKPIIIDDMKITPYLIDHSAYDAYMFLIEAEGKKVLHTGDFRIHGFRGKGVLTMLKNHVGTVDVLITEGTVLSRDDSEIKTEAELQREAKLLLDRYKYVFVICSSTNIDRIASFHEATPQGKYFLCDTYQKEVIDVAKKYGSRYSSLYDFRKALTLGKNLNAKAEAAGFTMMVRSNSKFLNTMEYYKKYHNHECVVIYSMWKGYLERAGTPLNQLLDRFQNVRYLHTSGHASIKAISDVCNIVRPQKAIIPIHSDNPLLIGKLDLPYTIECLNDGDAYFL